MTNALPVKRRILHKLKIMEVSAVDHPCQEHARMVIMKRDPDAMEKDGANIEGALHIPGTGWRKRNLARKLAQLRREVSKANPFHDALGRFAVAGHFAGMLAGIPPIRKPRSTADVNREMHAHDTAAERNRFRAPNPMHLVSGREAAVGLAALSVPIVGAAALKWVGGKVVTSVVRNLVTKPIERAALRKGLKKILASKNVGEMQSELADLTQRLETSTGRAPVQTIMAVASALKKLRAQEMTQGMGKAAVDPISAKLDLLINLLQNMNKFTDPKTQKIADRITLLKMQVGVFKFNANHDKQGRFAPRSGGGSETTVSDTKPGRLRRIAGRVATVGAATATAAALAWLALPHVFTALDKINGGKQPTARQIKGIIKYAESGQLRDKANALVKDIQTKEGIPPAEARARLVRTTEALIALRARQAKAGAKNVPLASVGLRSAGFKIPPEMSKAAQDPVLDRLKLLLSVIKINATS